MFDCKILRFIKLFYLVNKISRQRKHLFSPNMIKSEDLDTNSRQNLDPEEKSQT